MKTGLGRLLGVGASSDHSLGACLAWVTLAWLLAMALALLDFSHKETVDSLDTPLGQALANDPLGSELDLVFFV